MMKGETIYHAPKWSMCVWLDHDAKRCRHPAWRGVQFHGDPEWASQWIIAHLCRQHYAEYLGREDS